MTPAQKKKVCVGASALLLLVLGMQRRGRGTVHLGPVTVTSHTVDLGKVTEADLQRLTLALTRSRQLMGADPNTLASRQPTAAEQAYIQETLSSARVLSQVSKGALVYPLVEEERLTLAKKLPGDLLQRKNSEFYALLGIDPRGANEPTLPLTADKETRARSIIAQWRPYSQNAVDTLFVQLDTARELAALSGNRGVA